MASPRTAAATKAGFDSSKLETGGPQLWKGSTEAQTLPRSLIAAFLVLLFTIQIAPAADHLKLKPGLDFMKNAWQGPLIEGENLGDGIEKGKPNYIFMYGEFCFDAKRQALRTVEAYRDYGDRVHFVIIDLSRPVPRLTQMPLVNKYFAGFFPQTTILDADGKVVLDYTGEIDDGTLIGWLDSAIHKASKPAEAVAAKRENTGSGAQ